MDKADQIAPFKAMLDRGSGAVPVEAPDLMRDWLEPDAMLVDGPQLDGRVRQVRRHRAQQRSQTLFEVDLGLWVCLHMAWAGHPQSCTQAPQVGPAELTTNASTETLADPGGDCPPTPALPSGAPPAASAATRSSCYDALKSSVLVRD